MATISTLPASTAKLLTATQVITSPFSTLKELLENALDARATSIAIDISLNTLDVLQVRDNGHGIRPEDRGICCRRHTTSKLTSVQDLAIVAGNSLGFRGEALFAIAQVVGGMSVTTRIEGESTAVCMSVNREGEVTRRTVASAATGTMINVTEMFAKLPVRKQAAEKDAPKCLLRIKKFLQAHALARPHVRLQMRVLKAKGDKMNFSYAPKLGGEASVRDAAWKVIGSEPALQCSFYVLEVGSFTLHGLLPLPEAMATKTSNTGHFISIDQRPVSTTMGTPKQISKLVVQKMRASGDALANVKDPFFVLNIVCPQGSYDPNVEPAKDDVLFHDASAVLKAVGQLLSAVYPLPVSKNFVPDIAVTYCTETGEDDAHTGKQDLPSRRLLEDVLDETEADEVEEPDDIMVRTNPNPASTSVVEQHAFESERDANLLEEPVANTNELELLKKRAKIWRSDMYGYDDDDLDLFEMAQQEQERPASADAESLQTDKNDLNPWTIAKLNARHVPRKAASEAPVIFPLVGARSLCPGSNQQRPDNMNDRTTPTFNNDMQLTQSSRDNQNSDQLSFVDNRMTSSPGRGRRGMPTGLLTPIPSSSPIHNSLQKQIDIPRLSARQRQVKWNSTKAFKSPVRQVAADSDGVYCTRSNKRSKQPATSNQRGDGPREVWQSPAQVAKNMLLVPKGDPSIAAQTRRESSNTEPSEAEVETDFRARLRQAGEELDNHYAHRVMARQVPSPDEEVRTTSAGWTTINVAPTPCPKPFSPQPLAKRRRTTESKRTKSSKLPLERVPDDCELHHVVQCMSLSPAKLETSLFWFDSTTCADIPWNVAAADFEHADCQAKLSGDAAPSVGLRAIDMLKRKLQIAEGAADEDTAIAFARTFARLGRANQVEVHG